MLLLGFPLAVLVEEARIGCSAAGNITLVLFVLGGYEYDAAFEDDDKAATATCSVGTAVIDLDSTLGVLGVSGTFVAFEEINVGIGNSVGEVGLSGASALVTAVSALVVPPPSRFRFKFN